MHSQFVYTLPPLERTVKFIPLTSLSGWDAFIIADCPGDVKRLSEQNAPANIFFRGTRNSKKNSCVLPEAVL
jgi:hypothetical protein